MRVAGLWLLVAAALFWISWLLMPGVGITDASLILDLVGNNRERVQLSVVLQLISAACYAPAVVGFLAQRGAEAGRSLRWACALLLLGAMGSAADAVFHLMAVSMTEPSLLSATSEPLMQQIQGPGLVFILPLIAAFFAGSFWLAFALAREGSLSRWNPRSYLAMLAIVLAVRWLPADHYRTAALSVLLVVSVSQGWIAASWMRGRDGSKADPTP